ncbi:hypothetical protein QOZ80_1AG0003600 [Eleusine coracana subsp. coracana]|nr:hypothetical protein QOZ80_1AG0003600 [Eleusine coracana subsp. coracana]
MEFMGPHSTGDIFNDDEKPIDPGSNKVKPQPGFTDDDGGRISVKADHSKAAPLEATTVSVQLEVTSSSSVAGRAPLDLVVALDVGNNMCDGANLDQFKSAIDFFFIRRVSPMDRLSIVTFSDVANRLCPLIPMSEVGKFYVMGTVDGLMASSSRGVNIKAGLETAVEILAGRQYIAGRVGHILLLSDGHEDHGDARLVSIPCDVPIYTLAFGVDANMVLLQNLAQNGGMFNFVPDIGAKNVLLSVFSQLMIGLLQVAVEDLYVILSNPNSPDHDLDMIVKVASDSIHQETNRRLGTVTIKLAGLLGGQVRKVDAELLLFEADDSDHEVDILDISVSYPNTEGIRHIYKVQTLHITRSDAADHTSSSSLAALEKLP